MVDGGVCITRMFRSSKREKKLEKQTRDGVIEKPPAVDPGAIISIDCPCEDSGVWEGPGPPRTDTRSGYRRWLLAVCGSLMRKKKSNPSTRPKAVGVEEDTHCHPEVALLAREHVALRRQTGNKKRLIMDLSAVRQNHQSHRIAKSQGVCAACNTDA